MSETNYVVTERPCDWTHEEDGKRYKLYPDNLVEIAAVLIDEGISIVLRRELSAYFAVGVNPQIGDIVKIVMSQDDDPELNTRGKVLKIVSVIGEIDMTTFYNRLR